MNNAEPGAAQHSALLSGSTSSLVPKATYPFLIVSPPYTRASAGVTVLHLLCHYLNRSGESAFILQYPPECIPIRSLPSYATLQAQPEFPGGMLAPPVTQDVLEFYDQQQLTPIVIYPEFFDNPFKARFFGRYILNCPGKFDTTYEEREQFAVAYTKLLAEHCTDAYPEHPPITDVLFMPTADLDFWNTTGAAAKRRGTCHYAGTMQNILNKRPDNLPTDNLPANKVPDGSIEILRGRHMSRLQIRELFWRSEAFYCYEDTALAIEARLCGCPTVFVPHEHFSGIGVASDELGTNGSCLAGEVGGLERAKATIGIVEPTIRSHIASAPAHIAELAAKWKALAAAQAYQGTIICPLEPRIVFFDRSPTTVIGFDTSEAVEASKDVALGPGEEMAPEPSDMESPPRGGISSTVLHSLALIVDSVRTGGVRGLCRRVMLGLSRHGVGGFWRLLRGTDPVRQPDGPR